MRLGAPGTPGVSDLGLAGGRGTPFPFWGALAPTVLGCGGGGGPCCDSPGLEGTGGASVPPARGSEGAGGTAVLPPGGAGGRDPNVCPRGWVGLGDPDLVPGTCGDGAGTPICSPGLGTGKTNPGSGGAGTGRGWSSGTGDGDRAIPRSPDQVTPGGSQRVWNRRYARTSPCAAAARVPPGVPLQQIPGPARPPV